MFEAVRDPDLEWLLLDSTVIRAHQHAAGMNGGENDQALGRSRGGFGTKIHLAVDTLGNPVSIHLSPGQDADITYAETSLADHRPDAVVADKGYDSDALVATVEQRGAQAIIPPKKNRKAPRPYHTPPRNATRWNLRQRLEAVRRVATRYEKTSRNFLGMVLFTAITLWLKQLDHAHQNQTRPKVGNQMNRQLGSARIAVLALLLSAVGPALNGFAQQLVNASHPVALQPSRAEALVVAANTPNRQTGLAVESSAEQFAISPISLQVPPPPTPAVATAMPLPSPADKAPPPLEEIDPRIKAMVDKLVTDRLAQQKQKSETKAESTTNPPFKGVWKDGFWFQTANKDFTLHLGGTVQYDASFYNPQSAIETGTRPVLGLEDGANLRRARFRGEGTMYGVADFRLEMEFAQGVLAPGADPGLKLRTLQQITLTPTPTDAYITLLHLPVVEHFRIGNFKEPFGLEHLESHRFLYFMERSPLFDFFTPTAFNNGRCPGMMIFDTVADERMSYAVGVFKNVYDAYAFGIGDGEFATTGRLTFLPFYEDEGRYLVHVGVAGSHRDPVDGQIRFRSRSSIRNQSPIVPVLIDTGFITSSSQSLMALEAFVNLGSLSLQAEYMGSWNEDSAARNGPVVGTTFFQGFYVQALYWLTGEYTQWSKKETRPDRPRPMDNFHIERDGNGRYNCGWGAWQIGVRYSHIDANNLGINGGLLDDVTVGLNWILNPNIKFQWNYVWERRYGLASGNGNLNAAGMRVAFDF